MILTKIRDRKSSGISDTTIVFKGLGKGEEKRGIVQNMTVSNGKEQRKGSSNSESDTTMFSKGKLKMVFLNSDKVAVFQEKTFHKENQEYSRCDYTTV